MRFLAAACLTGACLATSPLLAADLFESPPMAMPVEQSELGSNWYIRGDIGYGQITQATVVPSAGLFPTITDMPIGDATTPVPVVRGAAQSTMGPDFGLGFGYRVNDWFRAEADWIYSPGPGWSTQKLVTCPEVANAVSNYSYVNTGNGNTLTAIPVGYQYDYTTCDGRLNGTQNNNTALATSGQVTSFWVDRPGPAE